MAKRRGRGEGSIYQRASDGRWVGLAHVGWEGAKRIRRPVYGRTQAEVIRKLRVIERAKDDGLPLPTGRGQKLSVFLEQWLTSLPATVKPSTVRSYTDIVRLYITPNIGRIRLDRLKPDDVQRMLDELEARGLSPNTRRLARSVLRRALRRAQLWGLVARNVAALVDGPRIGQAGKGRTLTPEQVRTLLNTARGDRLEAFVVITLSCGLRRGEALALTWDDVDLEGATLAVRRTLQRQAGKLELVEPKTKGSQRRINLPSSCVVMLKAHRVRQSEERLKLGAIWQNTGLVFTTAIGTPLDPDNVRRDFAKLTERAGLGRWTPHELRHSAASLMLAQGVPLEIVSEVLGHSSIRITKDVYGHLLPAQRQVAAEAMDRLLKGS